MESSGRKLTKTQDLKNIINQLDSANTCPRPAKHIFSLITQEETEKFTNI